MLFFAIIVQKEVSALDDQDIKGLIHELQGLSDALSGREGLSAPQCTELKKRVDALSGTICKKADESIDFKAIVDACGDGIYISDKGSVIRYVNPAYVQHTKLRPEDLIGKSGQQVLDEGIFKRIVTPEVIETKRPRVLMGYIRTVEGRDIYGYCTARPVFAEDGEIKYVIITLYDPNRLKAQYSEYAQFSNHVEAPIRVRQAPGPDGLEPVVGSSQALVDVYKIADRVAKTDATVLIYGESGVGKEGVADYVCANGRRKDQPFIKVNCAAIAPSLMESELFGYERGAFTGANSSGKIGLFERANHGTILLDEIGELSLDLQTKLLRVLQQKELLRVGSTKPIQLDVRIIASTNANLKKKIAEGTFREDLYYRLSTIPIFVPPLKDRREDITELISYYLDYYCQIHHRDVQFSDEFYAIFQLYNWPGNIRQLKNIVEYLVVCTDTDYMVNMDMLRNILEIENDEFEKVLPGLSNSMQSYEKMIITQALKKAGSVRKAAEILKIDPATMSRKISRYGIKK